MFTSSEAGKIFNASRVPFVLSMVACLMIASCTITRPQPDSGPEVEPDDLGFAQPADLLFPWPIGAPGGGLDLPSPRDEPTPEASPRPNFGEGPCGEAAARLWQEHLEDPFVRLVGASPASEQHLKEGADHCRRFAMPEFTGPCARSAERAFARSIIQDYRRDDPTNTDRAERNAQVVLRFCEVLRESLRDEFRPSWRGLPLDRDSSD